MSVKKRTVLIVVAVILLAAIAVAVLRLNGTGLSGVLSGRGGQDVRTGDAVEEINYQGGENSAYGLLDGKLILATESQVRIYEFGSEEIFTQSIIMSKPTVAIADKTAVVYDTGGTEADVINNGETTAKLTTDGEIISASPNESGWFVLCTQEKGYNGVVTVYNAKANPVYKWYSGEGYVIGADVSKNGLKMAALSVDSAESRVTIFRLDREEAQAVYSTEELGLKVEYLRNNNISFLTENSLTILNKNGEEKAKYRFDGNNLRGFSSDGRGNYAVVLSKFQVGTDSTVVAVNSKGEETGKLDMKEDVLDVSAKGRYVAVLTAGSIKVYTKDMTPYAEYTGIGSVKHIEVRDDGSVAAIGTYSSAIYDA